MDDKGKLSDDKKENELTVTNAGDMEKREDSEEMKAADDEQVLQEIDQKTVSNTENAEKNLNEGKDLDTLLHHLYIAHELAVNENKNVWFRRHSEDISNENIIKITLREAYWDLFREQLTQEPPKLDMAFELLAEIKKGLEVVMTPNITTLRKQVAEVLDLDLLRTQAEHGAIDVMYYARYITSVISKICAPVRDKTVAQLSKETDIVAIFRGIVEILSLMKCDLLSFSLAAIKPDIMANHLAYERDTFREYINAIGGTLPRTSKWLIKHIKPTLSAEDIICNAYIDILTWEQSALFPETLFLEEERLRRLNLDYFRLTVSCTILFLSLGLIPQSYHSDDFKESVKTFILIMIVEAKTDADVKKLCLNIAIHLTDKLKKSPQNDSSGKSPAEQNYKLFQETIEQASLPDNKIRLLVCTRVNDYLKSSLKTQNAETNFPPALNLFKPELTSLRQSFQNVFKHNMLVCMEHYQKLVKILGKEPTT